MRCDYCQSDKIKKIYRAPSTQRDIDICVCENCDLIQVIYMYYDEKWYYFFKVFTLKNLN